MHGLIEYALGVAFGRFDLRLATGERDHPPEPEPFDPLPACSPGMLVVESSQEPEVRSQENAEPTTAPSHHPTTHHLPPISEADLPPKLPPSHHPHSTAILVDRREATPTTSLPAIRQVLDLIWGTRPEDIEQEACQVLRGSSLREYFARSSSFFAEHLSRYSKSRRYAPIYWPLSTRSGSYTSGSTTTASPTRPSSTCINDFVEPKLHQVNQVTTQLRSKSDRTPRRKKNASKTMQDLELELIEFRDELLRIAQLPWKPNLNDGVQITAAPLWELFGLPKVADQTQRHLEANWARVSTIGPIWPTPSGPIGCGAKCKGDKSLAIAHDLEELYEEPTEANTQPPPPPNIPGRYSIIEGNPLLQEDS